MIIFVCKSLYGSLLSIAHKGLFVGYLLGMGRKSHYNPTPQITPLLLMCKPYPFSLSPHIWQVWLGCSHINFLQFQLFCSNPFKQFLRHFIHLYLITIIQTCIKIFRLFTIFLISQEQKWERGREWQTHRDPISHWRWIRPQHIK